MSALSCDLISCPTLTIFSYQLLRCLLINVKGKENSAGISLSAHIVCCQKPGKHLVLPCSHWVAHWHPVCLPWVSLTHTLLSASPSPLPEPPLPALMACRDASPSILLLHAISSLSGASLQFLNDVVVFFFFFSLLNGKQELFYIITFKMKNSLKALSWIALIFASLLTLRLFFSCNFPQMLQVFLNSEKQGLQHTG